jgi:hypothetical protein
MSQLGQLISVTLGVTSLTGDSGGALSGALKIKGGSNITTAAAGTDITVNVSGTTNHAIQLGNVGGSLSSLGVGATGTVLTGVTGADPAFSASPTVTTMYAGTFDTNVAAAAVTLSGTTLSADGTDVDININITAKGAGKVIIDDLQLTTDLAVTEGGTGVSTLLDHGLLVGSGAAAIDSVAVGATGTILQGVTANDPTWSTATYPSTVTKGDVLVASANNVVGVVNDVVNAGYLLTANVGAAPTFQAPPAGVTYASDAETIAGTVTNKAVAPSNLKAKLGTQTIHALPIGASDSAALGWLAVGTTGKYLRAATTADPGWSTLTLPDTVTKGDVLVASADNVVDIVAGATTAGWVLTANGALSAPTFQAPAAGGITSVSGTANQITASTLLGAVTLSTPNTFIAPGTIGATTTVTAGTNLISTAGYLRLPKVSSTKGYISTNSNVVFHQYDSGGYEESLYIGVGAGNFTTSQRYSCGVGKNTLHDATGGGGQNIAFGASCLEHLTSGAFNNAFGQTGGGLLKTGSYNLFLGGFLGSNYTGNVYTGSESSNIIIMNTGVVGESNKIRIGTYGSGNAQQDTAYIAGIVHASNGLISDAGNISATAGSVSASTTVTAGTDLTSTAGNLKLPTTSSTVGQVRINNVRVFHTYGSVNTFVGQESGNFTTTAGANTGIGTYTLQSLDTTASHKGGNSAFGYGSLQACTSGYNNVAFGNSCLYNLTQGHHNTSVGPYPTAYYLTTGSFNVTIGTTGLQDGISGSYWGSGKNLTSNETSNFLIGALGVTGESNRLEIGYGSGTGSAQINKAFIHGIYGRTPAGTLNVALIDSNGQLGSVASLSVANGGTGAATLTDHGILLGSGTGAITPLGVASDGQLPIGSTGADPVLATITAGANVTVTNGAGSITVASSINTVNDQTDSYQLVAGDAGKFITMTKGSANTLTVPKDATVNFAVGTYITVYQGGAGVTTIAPEDGTIVINSVAGNLDISAQYGVAKLHKIAANSWVAYGDLA